MTLNLLSLQRKALVRFAQVGLRNISISHSLRKNFYETLGVPRDASQADIKNAYFELSKMYHPDRIAATDENLAKFREISAAYEVLGNEQSRKLYDRGLLGEFKRSGIDDAEDIKDPIINFYKKRQDLSKIIKTDEEIEAWAKTYMKKEKSKFIRREDIIKMAQADEHTNENFLQKESFFLGVSFFICLLFYSNYENSRAHQMWKLIFG